MVFKFAENNSINVIIIISNFRMYFSALCECIDWDLAWARQMVDRGLTCEGAGLGRHVDNDVEELVAMYPK